MQCNAPSPKEILIKVHEEASSRNETTKSLYEDFSSATQGSGCNSDFNSANSHQSIWQVHR